MVTQRTRLDAAKLPEIERELADRGLRARFRDPVLEHSYNVEREEAARFYNRLTLPILILVFDAYIFSELWSIPEIVKLSLVLRFGLLTPLTVLYIVLDWRGWLGRWTSTVVTCLIVAPTLFACIESIFTTSPAAAGNFQAVPLIQLTVLGTVVSLRQVMAINAVSVVLFYACILTQHAVPPSLIPSMLLTDLAVCIATLVFSARIDLRNRQVFLFTQQSEIRGDILASQNRDLARMTRCDALTGLGNRRCFDEALATLWADPRRRQDSVALIMFDIDCFKQFNDSLGHQAGDECLATLARTVNCCLRNEGDTLVRYGGEEFAVVLPATCIAEAWEVAERVRLAVLKEAVPHPASTQADCVTVSLGVATVIPATSAVEALIEMADRCLYDAKRAGRNCTVADGFHPAQTAFAPPCGASDPTALSIRNGAQDRSIFEAPAERLTSSA